MKHIAMAFIFIVLISCQKREHSVILIEDIQKQEYTYEQTIKNDTLISFDFRGKYKSSIEIKIPTDSIKGCILLLHGWNLPASQWCDSTNFCDLALENKYALVIPELSLCNYPLKTYPETLDKYRNYPDLPWIIDSLIPHIQTHTHLLTENQNNFIAGISTGGRGATLLAYYKPELFSACASLSGDFDITKMQDEFLYKAWFGNYEDFKSRWEAECFAYNTTNYIVPTYIAHGKADKVSPWIQSKMMADSIKKNKPYLKLRTNFPIESGHNYKFWNSESQNIIDFFNNFH